MTESPDQRVARKSRKRGRALQREAFVESRRGTFDERALAEATAKLLTRKPRKTKGATELQAAFPTGDVKRWVPIGPSVVRRGQAEGRPRVAGRIRDLAVDATGQRAYAASAKGGVWYTDDAGTTWSPVGGFTERAAVKGGNNNAQACGCLLVDFGAMAALDFVIVGTGETVPSPNLVNLFGGTSQGGIGVLAGLGPATKAADVSPWEEEAGIGVLEGLGVFHLARAPGALPGNAVGPGIDQVLAATSNGLFLGTRVHVGAPNPHDEYSWAALAALNTFVGSTRVVSDVAWTPGGRIFAAVDSRGVAFSDDTGANWAWVTALGPPTLVGTIAGNMSFGAAGAARLYVLGEVTPPAPPGGAQAVSLWQINASAAAGALAATPVPGLPQNLWTGQRDYDQAIAVDAGAPDRVYVGGSVVQPFANSDWDASLWCFDVAAGPTLVPAPGVSRVGVPSGVPPPLGDGADQAGLIGNNVHGDIHAIRVTGTAPNPRQLWVGCDGGVYVSLQAGRCNSFQPRVTGLGVLEVGFHAAHPTSSHFMVIGCQDNGTQVRAGDTMWEETFEADGGGVAFHPTRSQYVMTQYVQGAYYGQPNSGFTDPLSRTIGGSNPSADREYQLSSFYCGASTVRVSPTVGRFAIGTNRVWITDDIGANATNTWRLLPFPGGLATDTRAGGADPPGQQATGVPPGGLGQVITVRWTSPNDLLALYASGLVRYTENNVTKVWAATVLIPGAAGAPIVANTTLSDVAPVPLSTDFYLTTTGDAASPPVIDTCYFFDSATATFIPTNLRHKLDTVAPVKVGPVDPAYSAVVDPVKANEVYVGTVSGVWQGVRTPGVANLAWTFFVNGLPQATVQDLGIWFDASAGPNSLRLLRAGVQSRGVWEVDLAAATEPKRTYVRVHARDDRRRFPTPMADPRRSPTATPEVTYASPDIRVRPKENPAVAPTWHFGAGQIGAVNNLPYHLWMFQTAFRWIYPSIAADASFSDQFGDLVELHRATLALPAGRFVDRALWNAVVGGTHLSSTGAVTANVADPLAVFRAPWQSAAALTSPATEADLAELIVSPRTLSDVSQIYNEPSTVEVLIHHRDTRALPTNDAFAALLWQDAASAATLTGANLAGLPAFAASLLTGAPAPTPAGWKLAGAALNTLPVALDARLPRAVSVDVDLSGVKAGHRVLFVAIVGSSADQLTTVPVGAPVTVTDMVKAWPNAAMRLVRVWKRPV